MLKYSIISLFCCLTFNAAAQNLDPGPPNKVKMRYIIQTIYGPGDIKRMDTMNCRAFNEGQKLVMDNDYKKNRVATSIVFSVNSKGQTLSAIYKIRDMLASQTDYFHDTKGNVIKILEHNFGRKANNEVIKLGIDTTSQSFDKAGNKILIEKRNYSVKMIFDANNKLVETDSYTQQNGKAQKTINIYKGKLLMETLSYWYDGKLYQRITNEYNSKQQLIAVRDSTTNWLQNTHYTYSETGLKALDISEKISKGKASKTTIEYTYDDQARLLVQTFKSNDPMLQALFPLSFLLKQPDYELKDIYTYDRFGNRLQITSELNGEKARVIDFLMTYYK